MTKDLPQQGANNSKEKNLSILMRNSLNDSPDRLGQLISFDNYATRNNINIVDLKEPVTNENLLIAHAFRKLMLPDKDQMLELFRYIFEKKQCNPNHLTKLSDGIEKVAKTYFNERGNVYVNTFLHTLIVNEHGNSLVENVLDLPQIKEKFNFNKKDVIIEGFIKKIEKDKDGKVIEKEGEATYIQGPNYNEKEGKTILCLAAKMRESGIVRKLCALKKEGINIDLDLEDEHGHTALFYSCALGDPESTNALLKAGANPNSVNQASIDSCRNNPTKIASILKSVSINPKRDEKALSNFFIHPNNHQPRLDDDHKINKKNEKTIISTINHIINKPTEYEQKLPKEAREEFVEFARMQILDSKGKSFLTGKSLLQSCLDGQTECFDLLELKKNEVKKYEQSLLKSGFKLAESPPGSIFSPEGKTLVPSKPGRTPK
jgi:hypothetical protein